MCKNTCKNSDVAKKKSIYFIEVLLILSRIEIMQNIGLKNKESVFKEIELTYLRVLNGKWDKQTLAVNTALPAKDILCYGGMAGLSV